MRISSWNTEGRLSRIADKGHRGSPEHIVNSIECLDSDLLFLPEAFDGDRPLEPWVEERLKKLGYRVIKTPYRETRPREYAASVDPHSMFLSRLEVGGVMELKPGDIRSMPVIDVTNPETGHPIRVIGAHLDDRTEENRLLQLEELILCIKESNALVVMMGDFNAMHGNSFQAQLLRNPLMRKIINRVPQASPRDKLLRLSGMAAGETLKRLEEETSLKDADQKRRSTETAKTYDQEWLPSLPLVQIDHIYTTEHFKVCNFSVARDGGSDHRAISADLMLTRQDDRTVL